MKSVRNSTNDSSNEEAVAATTKIHETAVVDPKAELGTGVEIGPFCIIGPDAVIGDNTVVEAHAIIESMTTIGRDCRVGAGAVLGGRPQDKKFNDEQSFLTIGDGNIIREYVTIHRGTGEGNVTTIGNNNMLMAYCHVGHNCTLGNDIMMANMVGISGHVIVEDKVVFGGMVGVHQFVRIGKLAMIGGLSKIVQDIPPFMLADGRPSKVYGLNVIGLRRNGVVPKVRSEIRQAFKYLFRSNLNLSQSIETIQNEIDSSVERDYLLEFLRNIKSGYAGRQLEHRG